MLRRFTLSSMVAMALLVTTTLDPPEARADDSPLSAAIHKDVEMPLVTVAEAPEVSPRATTPTLIPAHLVACFEPTSRLREPIALEGLRPSDTESWRSSLPPTTYAAYSTIRSRRSPATLNVRRGLMGRAV